MQWEEGPRAHLTGPSPACLHRPSVVMDHDQHEGCHHGVLGSTYSICQMAVGGLAFTLQDCEPSSWPCRCLSLSSSRYPGRCTVWGLFPWGEAGGESRGCPSPLPFLAVAPQDAETLEESDVVRPTGRDVEAQSFGVGISARGPRPPQLSPNWPRAEGSILYSH